MTDDLRDTSRKWRLALMAFRWATGLCLLWFATATALLWWGKIDAQSWQAVALSLLQTWSAVVAGVLMLYAGANVAQKFSPGGGQP